MAGGGGGGGGGASPHLYPARPISDSYRRPQTETSPCFSEMPSLPLYDIYIAGELIGRPCEFKADLLPIRLMKND